MMIKIAKTKLKTYAPNFSPNKLNLKKIIKNLIYLKNKYSNILIKTLKKTK